MNPSYVPGYRGQERFVDQIASMLHGVAGVDKVPRNVDLDGSEPLKQIVSKFEEAAEANYSPFVYDEMESLMHLSYFKGAVATALGTLAEEFAGADEIGKLEKVIRQRNVVSTKLTTAIEQYNNNVLKVFTPYDVQVMGYQIGTSFGFFRLAVDAVHFVWVFFAVSVEEVEHEYGGSRRAGTVTILGAAATSISKVNDSYPGYIEDTISRLLREDYDLWEAGEISEDELCYRSFGVSAHILDRTFMFSVDLPQDHDNLGLVIGTEANSILREEELSISQAKPFTVSPIFNIECGGEWYTGTEESKLLWMSLNGQKLFLRIS